MGVVFGRAQHSLFAQFGCSPLLAISSDGTRVPRGTLRAEHRERSGCVGNVCGSRPALARRGLRASVSIGRGGCPGRGHLRDAGVPKLPASRAGVSPVSGRSLRAPVSRALPTGSGLRRLRPGARVLGMAHAPRGAPATDGETLPPGRLSAGHGARVRGARPRHGIGMGDDLSDLSEERPLPYPVDLSEARQAPRCQCPTPLTDDGTCARCGHDLPGGEASEA